jgi:hypothetical protein
MNNTQRDLVTCSVEDSSGPAEFWRLSGFVAGFKA